MELVRAACETVSAKVPHELTIDYDGVGNIDNVTIVIKGKATGINSILWSHWWIPNPDAPPITINEKKVFSYNIIMEDQLLNDIYGVGMLAHEFGHSLGFPDLFLPDENGRDTIYPVGKWDLMSNQTKSR